MTYEDKMRDRATRYLASVSERHGFDAADILASLACSGFEDVVSFARQQRCSPTEILQAQMGDALASLRYKRDRQMLTAEREARAAKNGGHVCQRCDGAGGSSHWPGFTCFECDGRGWTL